MTAGIAFMGKGWDSFARGNRGDNCRKTGSGKDCDSPGFAKDVHWQTTKAARDGFIVFLTSVMEEAYRVLKPGAHGLVWALPRTSHWTAMALEDAGFEIRDRVSHIFGTGFPKSKNLSNGFGSALKPAVEDWWLIRKPLSEKNIAANVLRWGTGALNIDGCRIGTGEDKTPGGCAGTGRIFNGGISQRATIDFATGRFPSHLLLSHSPDCNGSCVDGCPVKMLDEQSGERKAGGIVRGSEPSRTGQNGIYGTWDRVANHPHSDTGGASRYFYCAKASRSDRGEGNTHPTVKSVKLMRYLCRLITPPGGLVFDAFMGSGSTGVAALNEGFDFIGIEREPEYFAIAKARIEAAQAKAKQLELVL